MKVNIYVFPDFFSSYLHTHHVMICNSRFVWPFLVAHASSYPIRIYVIFYICNLVWLYSVYRFTTFLVFLVGRVYMFYKRANWFHELKQQMVRVPDFVEVNFTQLINQHTCTACCYPRNDTISYCFHFSCTHINIYKYISFHFLLTSQQSPLDLYAINVALVYV